VRIFPTRPLPIRGSSSAWATLQTVLEGGAPSSGTSGLQATLTRLGAETAHHDLRIWERDKRTSGAALAHQLPTALLPTHHPPFHRCLHRAVQPASPQDQASDMITTRSEDAYMNRPNLSEVEAVTTAIPRTQLSTRSGHGPSTEQRGLSVTPPVLQSMTTPQPRMPPERAHEVRIPQVSSPSIPGPSHRYGNGIIEKQRKEVVRVQRSLLGDDEAEPGTDLEAWSVGHIMRDSVNPVTLERTLHIHFQNGEEQDVCEGAVYRPSKRKAQRLHWQGAGTPQSLVQQRTRLASPALEYCGNASSADCGSSNTTTSTESDSGCDSEATDTDATAPTSQLRSTRLERPRSANAHCGGLTSGEGLDSEATLSEFEVDKLGRPPARGSVHTAGLRRCGPAQDEPVPYGRGRAVPRPLPERVPRQARCASTVQGRGRAPRAKRVNPSKQTSQSVEPVSGAEDGSSDSWYRPPKWQKR
jgi:hypothetical protein